MSDKSAIQWRRDEYGWLTYPFWTLLCKLWPLRLNQGRIGKEIGFAFATRAYGEQLRWQQRRLPR